ncbi:MAG: CopG family ribbon-helix-helix protein [Permianibacter sp.]
MSSTMTIRLDDAVKNRLEKLSEAMDRSKSYLASEAIREYLELNEWQIAETKSALAEADAGDFASEADVKALADKWGRDAG